MDTGIRETVERWVAVACIVLAVLTIASMAIVPVAAQQGTFSDDFEDGSVSGWESDSPNPEISDESVEGDHSLYMNTVDSGDEQTVFWESGPTINLNESFTLSATIRPHHVTEDNGGIRIGLTGENTGSEGQNALLMFNQPTGETYLATSWDETGIEDSIPDSFNDQWVNIEITSEGDGVVSAKVWEYGTAEPTSPQLQRQFDPISGAVGLTTGNTEQSGENERELWLDSVTVQGERVVDSEELRLDIPKYLPHNESSSYAVEANQSGDWVDVTGGAAVTPDNLNALTFYPSNSTVVAGSNETINERVNVTAEYQGLTTTGNTSVATTTVDNLDLMPIWWKVTATFSDSTIFWAIVATFVGVGAARVVSLFAGLAAYQIVMTLGWIMGEVHQGTVIACLFIALFIGLNVSENLRPRIR